MFQVNQYTRVGESSTGDTARERLLAALHARAATRWETGKKRKLLGGNLETEEAAKSDVKIAGEMPKVHVKSKPSSVAAMKATVDTEKHVKPKLRTKAPVLEPSAVSPTTTVLVKDATKNWGLDPDVVTALEQQGIHSFFPVQCQAIPVILDSLRQCSNNIGGDICVGAPTGSGKTLVYALPLLHSLKNRLLVRLRALVVLPTRDLALQVHAVFVPLCRAVGLNVGLAIGQTNFEVEQASLVVAKRIQHEKNGSNEVSGSSAVDILIATPGRLMEHLERTPGFTLQHLQLLVVDEADRLLNQSYQDWISRLHSSAYSQTCGQVSVRCSGDVRFHPTTIRKRHGALKSSSATGLESTISGTSFAVPLRRLLFSATLTRNPRKLALMGLLHPIFIHCGGALRVPQTRSGVDNQPVASTRVQGYLIPQGLKEYSVVCEAGEKPLILLYTLRKLAQHGRTTIIFTTSLESTHRLLQLFGGLGNLHEFSSLLSQSSRADVIQQLKNPLQDDGKSTANVLVSSDAMARGMDIPRVDMVINYDAPSYIKTYIHRIGRTARAGQSGTCVTLLKQGQLQHFKSLLQRENGIETYPIERGVISELMSRYRRCLQQLKLLLQAEDRGEIQKTAKVHNLPE